MIEGQMDLEECIALAEQENAETAISTPYFDAEGNEGDADEVHS